jgi:hypothetical protein
MDYLTAWWATVPAWAKPVLLGAGIAVAVGISTWILTKAVPSIMRLWIDHLVERALPRIDAILAMRTPHGANIFEKDVKASLGIWRPLRFKIMERLEKRKFVERLAHSEGEARWLRLS